MFSSKKLGHRSPVEVVVLYVEDPFDVAPLVVEREGIIPEGHVQGNCSAVGRCWDFRISREGLVLMFQHGPIVFLKCLDVYLISKKYRARPGPGNIPISYVSP